MGLGVTLIALCAISLLVSFIFTVPAWINLFGILFGIAGLFLLNKGRKSGGDGA